MMGLPPIGTEVADMPKPPEPPLKAVALPYLRRCFERSREIPELQIMNDAEKDVVGRFGTAFRAENLDDLTTETVTDFLRGKVKHHWYGLERNSSRMTAEMPALRGGMADLLDYSAPLAGRWEAALPRMHGVGKWIASAMLLVVYPAQCGGWNSNSVDKLAWFGLIPEPWLRRLNGSTYERDNLILPVLADSLGIDIWELDGIWYLIDAVFANDDRVERHFLQVKSRFDLTAKRTGPRSPSQTWERPTGCRIKLPGHSRATA